MSPRVGKENIPPHWARRGYPLYSPPADYIPLHLGRTPRSPRTPNTSAGDSVIDPNSSHPASPTSPTPPVLETPNGTNGNPSTQKKVKKSKVPRSLRDLEEAPRRPAKKKKETKKHQSRTLIKKDEHPSKSTQAKPSPNSLSGEPGLPNNSDQGRKEDCTENHDEQVNRTAAESLEAPEKKKMMKNTQPYLFADATE